jgi:hypothetical protein
MLTPRVAYWLPKRDGSRLPETNWATHFFALLAVGTMIASLGCAPLPLSSFQSSQAKLPSGQIKVSVSPDTAVLAPNQKQQFTANVSGTANTAVKWSASSGSIDSSGLYTAPGSGKLSHITITAMSNADITSGASALVKIENASTPSKPTILTSSVARAEIGNTYSQALDASGGTQPYSWRTVSGTIPAGLKFSPDGQISGTPTAAGTFSFAVSVTDSRSLTAEKTYSLTVTAGGNFDGPAELPRVTMSTSMASTPAPGKTLAVAAGGNLQAALNSAECGDTITLQEGATFTGAFHLPAKSCDDSRWIIIRTSASDNALPPEGQRATPCYAGVAELNARPQYACGTPKNVMARLVMAKGGNGPVILDSGASHYRLVGLEITNTPGIPGGPTLIAPVQGGTADHIIIDRSWVHGTARDDTRAGMYMAGMSYVGVVDSYFSDFHCTSGTGQCSDSHTLIGGLGTHEDKVYQIENNFLEASGEGLLFGGGPATFTPSDIVIRHNHFFKPWTWKTGTSGFVGGASGNPFVVKNHLELKNAQRVLIENNLMENVWGGFGQTGYAILLTPLNQRTPTGNVCSVCEVADVTVRYTHISHAASGLQLATSYSSGAAGLAGTRWSIHDVVLDDISRNYVGDGRLVEVLNGWPTNSLNNISISHITGFADPNGGILFVGNHGGNQMMTGFTFTDNVVTTGKYPVWNVIGSDSCAVSNVPAKVFSSCFQTYSFSHNALIASPSSYPPSSWPAGNFYQNQLSGVGFADYKTGNYQLQSSSPDLSRGTDGRPLGADIAGLDAALMGVE